MIYYGKEKENHKGSKVCYPILKVVEKKFNDYDNPIIEWVEGTLLEPVVGQIVITKEHGLSILSHGQYSMVKIIDDNLWDEECDEILRNIKDKLNYKEPEVV